MEFAPSNADIISQRHQNLATTKQNADDHCSLAKPEPFFQTRHRKTRVKASNLCKTAQKSFRKDTESENTPFFQMRHQQTTEGASNAVPNNAEVTSH